MAVGVDADTDRIYRSGMADSVFSDGAFANCGTGVWLYRPTSGNSYSLTSEGCIISYVSGAREIKLGFDGTFGSGTAADPQLQIIFNSGGGTGATQTFTGANFLDEWVYYFIYEDGTDQVAGYIQLSAPTTVVKITRANDNAGSQYINDFGVGNYANSGGFAVMGHYAYARHRYGGATITDSTIIAWAADSATISGDTGFWPLADNTDTGDDSGNSNTLTFGGTLSSESDPTLGGGSGPKLLTLTGVGI